MVCQKLSLFDIIPKFPAVDPCSLLILPFVWKIQGSFGGSFLHCIAKSSHVGLSNVMNLYFSSSPTKPEVGGLLPITSQKNDGSEGKKLLINLPSDVVKRITVLLTIEGVANTIALFIIHVITSSPVYYSVEKLNSDTAISSSAKFYIDKSSGVKLYAERAGCIFNVTILQGSINYVPLTNVGSIPSSAESISII